MKTQCARIERSPLGILKAWVAVAFAAALTACGAPQPQVAGPTAIRLVDIFSSAIVTGTEAPAAPPRAQWRFADAAAESNWTAERDVADLAVVEGRLTGKTTGDGAAVRVEWTGAQGAEDRLHSIQVTMSATAGENLAVAFQNSEEPQLNRLRGNSWSHESPILPGDEVRTYTIESEPRTRSTAIRHVYLRPTDAADAQFEIESVRLIFQREHLAETPAGVGWHGLAEIYRESLVAKAPETIELDVDLPSRPWLDLWVGKIEETPITFRVEVAANDGEKGGGRTSIERTLTTSNRWEPASLDLKDYAGKSVRLRLSLQSDAAGTIGYWGAPVIRQRMTDAASAASNPPPRGVILVMCDTIRRDHLNLYGYERETAPNLARVVREGALFTNTIAQATWTKVSTPSILSGLYPTTHTVEDVPDRLPNSAETLAEIFREAGYATLAFSSVGFSGASTNLHQGFEVMHEAGSRTAEKEGKSAREYVDRLLPWLREHKDSPFFVFLHVFDPHSPFEPRAPFDALWTDAERKAEHEARMEKVRPNIANSRLRGFGMPTREEIEKSDVPVDPFIQQMKDWYDGSIRGMDAEMGRLFEELRALGIDDTTVVAFVGDHGEEFLDHGRTWHGHSVYGELTNVPMLIWRPGLVAAGAAVAETVQTIDLYPTLLDLVGLKTPENVQGRSLRPLIGGAAVAGATWTPRPAVSEKAAGRGDSPNLAHGSIAIVADGWRLIRNTDVEGDLPEIELFNEREDPLNQVDVAEANPEIVEKMKRDLERWQRLAEIAQLKSDEELVGELSAEELKRLRSLGYIK